ncbi:hypothetical protein Scep_016489 [Stephania cephalantha]|uniref:FAD-binding PCMH-type domain-containing protein n=1 Tax=Stephania cephalantha TaxID=152367 RepID=A0AAP0IPI4_9MAGN
MIQNPIFTRPDFSKPATIVLPQSKQQLASTIICSRRYGSWTIRLRSGGHSYEGLSHTAQTPFVIIDFMNLNRVELDLQSETAWVESGATLGELYYAISQASDTLAFPAGISIYAWKIKLVHVPEKVTALTLYKPNMDLDVAAEFLEKWQLVGPTLDDRFTLTVAAKADTNYEPWGVLLEFHGSYLGPKSDAMSIMSLAFPELGIPEDEYLEVTWVEAIAKLGRLDSPSRLKDRFLKWDERAFKTKVDFPRSPLPLKGMRGILEWLLKEQHGFVVMNGYNGMMSKIRKEASPFPHRNGTLMMIEYLVAWKMEEDFKSDKFLSWLRDFHDYMGQFINNKPRVSYVNHVDLDLGVIDWRNQTLVSNAVEISRKWNEKYFLQNYYRMRGILEWLLKEQHGFVVMNGYNGMMSKIRKEASPFPHRNGTLMMIEYLVAWKMEEDFKSDKFLSWLRDFHDYMGQFINNKPRVSYVNHVDLDLGVIDWRNQTLVSNAVEISRKWNEKYFLQNYYRLVRAKTLIDPNNVFQHPQSIPPLPGLIEHGLDDF